MNYLRYLCCLFCYVLISNVAFSGTMGSLKQPYVIGLSVGPTWGSGNQTQTFYLQPDVLKSYIAQNNNQAFTTAELFIAKQYDVSEEISSQKELMAELGIVLAGAGNAKLSGDIWEEASPNFNNSDYRYKLNHAYVGIQARLFEINLFDFMAQCHACIKPYLSGSLGVAFNRAYDFKNTPKIAEEVAEPNFANQTKTSFAYTLGAGLEKTLTKQLHAAIGYEFADWGATELARATEQTLNQGLSLKHFYAQQLQFSLFYIF